MNQEHLNYKSLINFQNPPWFLKYLSKLSPLCGWLLRIPGLGWLCQGSFILLCLGLRHFQFHRDYKNLYRFLFAKLRSERFARKRPMYWWYLMRWGVVVTQQRRVETLLPDPEIESELISTGLRGPKPLLGYDVAYAYLGFSLWMFERGDLQTAVVLNEVAVSADNTWGYSEYLLGWYGLFDPKLDPVEHFAKAVSMDWNFLQKMRHDRMCLQHPDIIHQVQQRVVVANRGPVQPPSGG